MSVEGENTGFLSGTISVLEVGLTISSFSTLLGLKSRGCSEDVIVPSSPWGSDPHLYRSTYVSSCNLRV